MCIGQNEGVSRSEDEMAREDPGMSFDDQISDEIPGLYRYAFSLVGEPAEAEDVVGETLLRAIEHKEQFRSESSLRTWLHQILHNIAIDRARHYSHDVLVENIDEFWNDVTYSVDASALVERAEIHGELRDALLHLPFNHRTVVVLHDAEGWPLPEIANALGIGVSAAKQRLRRGRMMLVGELDQGEVRRVASRGLVLTCVEARGKVSDYIDDDLPANDRSRLEEHLAVCASCPPIFQALVGVKHSLGTLHDPDSVVPPGLARRLSNLSLGDKRRP